MAVNEHPTKPGHFIVDCRPDGYKGRRIRQVIEGSREYAELWEKSVMRRHVEKFRATNKTCTQIFPIWHAYYKNNRAAATATDAESCWKNQLKPVFGNIKPKLITRGLIEKYKLERLQDKKRGDEKSTKTIKPRTINKELAYLSSMLTWAAENDYCDPLPFKISGFPKKKTRAPKPRPLTPDQVTAIYENIEPHYRLIFLLMADAGLRAGEAFGLQREQVEFEQELIYVVGKGNKERIVPITTRRLLAELERKKNVSGWLTVNKKTKKPYTSIKKALARAATAAGIEKHIYHHLLRHSFGTNATIAETHQSALQSIMGHADPQTTAIYQNLAGDYLKTQGRKLEKLTKKTRPGGPGHGQAQNTETKEQNTLDEGSTNP